LASGCSRSLRDASRARGAAGRVWPGADEHGLGARVADRAGSVGPTIGYLHRIRKAGVARLLAKNRAFIRRQLTD
jgi:hypothetical protein